MIKKVKFNKSEIQNIPNEKPILYRIQTDSDNDNYIGIAQRGRGQERLTEHLGKIPGEKVVVEQFSNIEDARNKEKKLIKRNQPKYNKQDK